MEKMVLGRVDLSTCVDCSVCMVVPPGERSVGAGRGKRCGGSRDERWGAGAAVRTRTSGGIFPVPLWPTSLLFNTSLVVSSGGTAGAMGIDLA